MADTGVETDPHLRMREPRGRWVLTAAVLGSGVAFLDGSIVNVALPQIQRGLDASFADLQWVVDAYLLMLGTLVLVGGALGDLFGRRRVFLVGLLGFGVASVACGLATSPAMLVAARGAQGVAAALLVPGSLAIIAASFHPGERGAAIGAWSGLSGVSTALGPFVGGYLIDVASWRWAFLINVPLIGAAVTVTVRHVPESRAAGTGRTVRERLDLPGVVTAVLGLGLLVFPLIEFARLGTGTVAALLAAGTALLTAFVVIESRRQVPMLPLSLFRSRVFTAANVLTFAVYGGLGGSMFLLAIELQDQLGYSALEAGAATLPITVFLLLLSARVGRLLPRVGLRLPLTVGPFVGAAGLLLLVRVEPGATYLGTVLPGVTVFAIGLVLVVAPVTTAAMGGVEEERSGLASGVNNAVARIAGLMMVAVLPLAAGLSDVTSGRSADFTDGFQRAMVICAAALMVGGLVALLGLPGRSGATVTGIGPAVEPREEGRRGAHTHDR